MHESILNKQMTCHFLLQLKEGSSPISSAGSATSSSATEYQDRDVSYEVAAPTIRVRVHSNHVSPVTPPELKNMMLSPIKTSALNGEMTGVRTRPLSCGFSLQLPPIADFNENDETFREMTVEHVVTLIQRVKNSWIIEEPGFDPGDVLIAVNGTNVEDMDRDSVIRLLKEGVGGRVLHVSDFFFIN